MPIGHTSGAIIIEDTQRNFHPDFNDGSSYTLYSHISGISQIITLGSLGEINPESSFGVDPMLILKCGHGKRISVSQNII